MHINKAHQQPSLHDHAINNSSNNILTMFLACFNKLNICNRKSFAFIYVVFLGNRFGQGLVSFDYSILKNALVCNSIVIALRYFGDLTFAKNISIVAAARIMRHCDLGVNHRIRKRGDQTGANYWGHLTNHQLSILDTVCHGSLLFKSWLK